jgi:hypothetical protein
MAVMYIFATTLTFADKTLRGILPIVDDKVKWFSVGVSGCVCFADVLMAYINKWYDEKSRTAGTLFGEGE